MSINDRTLTRQVSIIVGSAIIIMALAAAYSYGFVINRLIVTNDPQRTFHNIISSHHLFSMGILGWLVIIIADILAAWGLYIFFKEVNKIVALLAAFFRMSYVVFLTTATANLVIVNSLTDNSPIPNSAMQSDVVVTLLIQAFNHIWSIGLILFGLHLLLIAYLILKTKSINKVFSILIAIAALSYIYLHGAYSFFPQFDKTTRTLESILSIPMTIAELAFALWLLIRGGKKSI